MTTVFYIACALVCILIAVGAFILNNERKKELENELKKAQNKADAAEEVIKNYSEAQKENEELIQRATSGNTADSADASVELLHNISKKGKDRNSSK